MEILQDKYKRSGLIGTLLVHIILFLIFIFAGLSYPVPLPDNSIVINFGTDDAGRGNSPTQAAPQVNKQQDPNPNPQESKAVPTANKEVVTQDSDAPSVKTEKETKKEVKPKEETKPKEEERKVDQRALFPGKKDAKEGGGDGNTDKEGDQGKTDGDKNSTSYTGGSSGGGGGGDSYKLGNRNAVLKKKPIYDCPETGKVVVDIIVDRNGVVISAIPGGRGTTTTDNCLNARAKEAALKTSWEPNPTAPERQSGTITYDFSRK
jgi:outer membrane biosynthesis protein TonB